MFTSSESLLAFQRETIEQAFGAPVRDRYGVSEFCVSMTECRERRLHVDMEFGIVEVEVEEESEDWERGPLLVTGLANDATPLLRYRVGDVGTRAKTPCPCGRPGDVFLDVDGRIEDYVMTPDGRLVGRLDHIFKEQLDVAEAQIVQETRDAVEVRVVRRPSWSAASERSLMKEIRSRLGDAIRVELAYLDAIPRESNGKFRAVKSAVGRQPAMIRVGLARTQPSYAGLEPPFGPGKPFPELAGLLPDAGVDAEPRVRRRARGAARPRPRRGALRHAAVESARRTGAARPADRA